MGVDKHLGKGRRAPVGARHHHLTLGLDLEARRAVCGANPLDQDVDDRLEPGWIQE